jgi:hypothetical protein
VAVVVAVAGCGGDSGSSVKVHALWYGKTADGKTRGGVTPIGITAARDNPKTPLSVDLRGLRASGAGPMWTATTAVAATQAALVSGVDPRLQELKYSLRDTIDGPSAGALLSVGSLAALRGLKLSGSTTMTGTVLPDGSVGPVGGIAEKLQAAAAAGFTRVLVPAGMRFVSDPRTDKRIDLSRGRAFGVKVTPVASVPQAYSLMTSEPTRAAERQPAPISPGLLRMLAGRSRALIAAAQQDVTDLSRGAGGPAENVTQIRASMLAARRALSTDPVYAFAASSEAALAGQQAVAVVGARAAARHTTLNQLAVQLARSARQSEATIRRQVRATAELPVSRIAQLTALSDCLTSGTSALTALDVAETRLKTVRTEAQLEEIVRFLEAARFDASNNMTACASSLAFLGKHQINRRTVSLLDAYADLIAYAADANRRYADSLGLRPSNTSYLGQLLKEADDLSAAVSPDFRNLRGQTARPALRLSVALLEDVESTQLVNNLTYSSSSGPPNLAPIRSPLTVRSQAHTADAIASEQVRELAAAGRDPSFLQWSSQWGADLAFGRLPNTTQEQTLRGLQSQWFAVLQSRLLDALAPR